VPEVPKLKRTASRGSGKFPASSERVKLVAEMIQDRQRVADGLGITRGFLNQLIAGKAVCSRTLDLAAEAIIRRHGKDEKKPLSAVIVARVRKEHWVTTRAMMGAMGGSIVEEIDGLDCDASSEIILAVVFMTPPENASLLKTLIEKTDGSCKVLNV
jgi:hypothetical protein